MHTRYYAQRQHLVQSLDALVHQLFTLSFFMSPSILILLSRLVVQVQCARPREFDPTYHLRFFYGLVVAINSIVFYVHGTQGASEGRALIIDFVGMSYRPSKLQLLSLDLFIFFLQLLITTIAYETHLYYTSEESNPSDMLLPNTSSSTSSSTPAPPPPFSLPSSPSSSDTQIFDVNKNARQHAIPCIVDLRLSPIMTRLRNPAPDASATSTDSLLPLPNTTSLPLPPGIRMIMRTNARTRRERGGGSSNGGVGSNNGARRVPGGLG